MIRALIASALICTSAHAEGLAPSTMGLHIGSHHFTARESGTWNDSNPGLYARWDSGLVLGTLRNSERRQSVYAAYVMESQRWNGLSAAVMVGGITGYSRSVSPMASVSVAAAVTDRALVRVSLLPKAYPKGSAVVHLSTEWGF